MWSQVATLGHSALAFALVGALAWHSGCAPSAEETITNIAPNPVSVVSNTTEKSKAGEAPAPKANLTNIEELVRINVESRMSVYPEAENDFGKTIQRSGYLGVPTWFSLKDSYSKLKQRTRTPTKSELLLDGPSDVIFCTATRKTPTLTLLAVIGVNLSFDQTTVAVYKDLDGNNIFEPTELAETIVVTGSSKITRATFLDNGSLIGIDPLGEKIRRFVDSDGDQVPDQESATHYWDNATQGRQRIDVDRIVAKDLSKVKLIVGVPPGSTITRIFRDTDGDGKADTVAKAGRKEQKVARFSVPPMAGAKKVFVSHRVGRIVKILDSAGVELGSAEVAQVRRFEIRGVASVSLSRPLVTGETITIGLTSDSEFAWDQEVKSIDHPHASFLSPELIDGSANSTIEIFGSALEANVEAVVLDDLGVETPLTIVTQSKTRLELSLPPLAATNVHTIVIRSPGEFDKAKWSKLRVLTR